MEFIIIILLVVAFGFAIKNVINNLRNQKAGKGCAGCRAASSCSRKANH